MKLDQSQFAVAEAYRGNVAERVTQFLPMVRKLAWHLSGSTGPTIDIDDLMQAGLVALTQCAQRHSSPSDDGFAAYAKMRVRGAMVDLLRSSSADPRDARSKRRIIERMKARLHGELGREASSGEIARGLGMTVEDYFRLESDLVETRISSIDECYSESDIAFAAQGPDAEDRVLQEQDRAALVDAIASLDERRQLVIQLYFVEELNLSEIAAILEISVPRVHQLKAAALSQMRKALGESE